MTPFDPKSYEEQVVKPLRGRKLPDDLLTRYAVSTDMSDAQLAQRLQQVRSCWNKGAGKATSVKLVYKAFLKADDELKRQHGARLSQMSWWNAYAKARQDKFSSEIVELAATVKSSFGELGLISTSQLQATMRAGFPSLTPAEAEQALKDAGVAKATPIELPKQSGLQSTLYKKLSEQLAEAGAASVPAVVFQNVTGFKVVTSFSCAAGNLDAAAIEAAVQREYRRSGNEAAKEALGILARAAKDSVDLRLLTLYHLVDDVRRHRAEGAAPSALLKPLLQAKLDPAEARLVVFSVLNESTTRDTKVNPAAAVTELLEQGLLLAAQQALGTVVAPEEAASLKALVERQVAEVHRLRSAARQAMASGNEAEAQQHLRAAAKLAADDDDLAAELRKIPPAPVLALSAQAEGLGVRVAWQTQPSHADDTKYRLVRREDRSPADPDDGVTVSETSKSVASDSSAPAARTLHYAVFASVPGGPWSRPAVASIEVLPPVTAVRFAVQEGRVDAQWQVHPDVRSVSVTKASGETVATMGKTQFYDRVTEAGEHVYTFVAHYRRPDGTDAAASPVSAGTSGGGRIAPVSAISLTPVGEEGNLGVAVTWRQTAEAEVVIRRSAHPAEWEFGAAVTSAQLRSFGQELVGRHQVEGEWHTLTATVPTGHFHYVPFTLNQDGAICGLGDDLGLAVPVRNLRHQRLGDEVVLSWIWPENSGSVQVSWRTTERAEKFRYTHQQYQLAGGCRIKCGAAKVSVSVRAIGMGDGGECFSPDVTADVPGMLPKVTYTVESARKLIGPSTVRIRLTADQPLASCPIVVVVAPGVTMPRKPGDGQVVLRGDTALQPGQPAELTAEFAKTPKPYWIRCFAEDGSVRLVDPPTSQLKVS